MKGRDELDPFNYLHLSLEEKSSDIRGSHIAISCSYSSDGESMTAIVVNFMDGRWRDEVLMPGKRILKGLQGKDEKKDPFLFHLVYFTSALCWWTDALSYVDDQLIEFVGSFERCFRIDLIH